MPSHVCTTCGYRGAPERIVPGSLLVGCALLFFFLIPGIIYGLWQQSAVYQGCPKCKGRAMIPIDAPFARQFMASARAAQGAGASMCPSCATPVPESARFCNQCGAALGDTPEARA